MFLSRYIVITSAIAVTITITIACCVQFEAFRVVRGANTDRKPSSSVSTVIASAASAGHEQDPSETDSIGGDVMTKMTQKPTVLPSPEDLEDKVDDDEDSYDDGDGDGEHEPEPDMDLPTVDEPDFELPAIEPNIEPDMDLPAAPVGLN